MQPFISLTSLDLINNERRADPRLIAAAGYPLPTTRRKPRRTVGVLLVRIGRWIEGERRDLVPDAATTPA